MAHELLTHIETAAPSATEEPDHRVEALRDALREAVAGPELADLTEDDRVILLLDHSGSMKGAPIVAAGVIADVLGQLFDRRRTPYEVLGYTTRNWRGGRSRQRWIEVGRPQQPGRLCDLRHIVYRSFIGPGTWRQDLRLMSFDVLREGVDGEAIEWAAGRMPQAGPRGRRVIIHIGDGSPVDDSTQQANGPWLLEDHFIEATARAQAAGLGYLLLTFRRWDVNIPQVPLDDDPVRCAAGVAAAVRSLFSPDAA